MYVTRITTQTAFANSEPIAMPTGSWIPAFQRNFDTADGKQFVTVLAASAGDAHDVTAPQLEVVLNWFEELKRLVPR